MKIKHNKADREIAAVRAAMGLGLFIPREEGGVLYFDFEGYHEVFDDHTLQEILDECEDREPILKGDEITLEF